MLSWVLGMSSFTVWYDNQRLELVKPVLDSVREECSTLRFLFNELYHSSMSYTDRLDRLVGLLDKQKAVFQAQFELARKEGKDVLAFNLDGVLNTFACLEDIEGIAVDNYVQLMNDFERCARDYFKRWKISGYSAGRVAFLDVLRDAFGSKENARLYFRSELLLEVCLADCCVATPVKVCTEPQIFEAKLQAHKDELVDQIFLWRN